MSTAMICIFAFTLLATIGSLGFGVYIALSVHRYASRMSDDEHRIGCALALFCFGLVLVGAFTSYQAWILI